ncbi:hypothetical protein ACFQ6H_16935 [Rhodococcus sp. NPDC056506]|uniref:hypothetical protein n=1 Tax=Rhodococcus sp. NPDC056506 TaxID=3345844 RepID=UPI00366FC1F3
MDGNNYDYLLVHTEPGTNKITAYQFDPGTAKSFHLEQPGSAPMTRPTAGVGAAPIAHTPRVNRTQGGPVITPTRSAVYGPEPV